MPSLGGFSSSSTCFFIGQSLFFSCHTPIASAETTKGKAKPHLPLPLFFSSLFLALPSVTNKYVFTFPFIIFILPIFSFALFLLFCYSFFSIFIQSAFPVFVTYVRCLSSLDSPHTATNLTNKFQVNTVQTHYALNVGILKCHDTLKNYLKEKSILYIFLTHKLKINKFIN